jgi:hypothetical protein
VILTAETFPSPDRIYTFAENRPLTADQEAELDRRKAFSQWEADEANAALDRLRNLDAPPNEAEWGKLYQSIIEWRHRLGVGWVDQKVVETQRNFLTPISDDNPNLDRFGDSGRFRIDAEWDKKVQMFVGGELSLAGRALIKAGERIHLRMDKAGARETLQNRVQLLDGTFVNGNYLFRGGRARQLWRGLKDRLASRGVDVSKFETGGDIVLARTATAANRTKIFRSVMHELARLSLQPEDCTEDVAAQLNYLLFQAPKNKRGSDSVVRVYNAVTSTYLLGEPLVLPPDADLRKPPPPCKITISIIPFGTLQV